MEQKPSKFDAPVVAVIKDEGCYLHRKRRDMSQPEGVGDFFGIHTVELEHSYFCVLQQAQNDLLEIKRRLGVFR